MRDAFPLNRRRGKTGVLKDTQVTDYGRNHCEKAEILRGKKSRQDHDGREAQHDLGTLRPYRDKSSRDRASLEIAQEMISAKMFVVRFDPLARAILCGSF